MIFGLQPIHIVFILLVALLLFGPKKLPEMGRSVGKMLNEFRSGAREVTDSLRGDGSVGATAGGANNPAAPASSQPTPAQSIPFQAPSIAPPRAGNFCIHCGARNAPEARFCNQCGQQLPENSILPAGPASVGQQ